ncbi:MAG: ABC transporter substrate-binding protein [Lachnospiraceae bacterium]
MKKNFKNIVSILTTTALLAGSLTACGVQGSIAESNTTAGSVTESGEVVTTDANATASVTNEKKDFGKLTVSYPTGNIRVTINILALEKGYFEEEGVEVVPLAVGGNDALTAINEDAGQLDILTAGFVADVQAIGAGYDLKFVAGTAVEGGAVIAKKGNADKYRGTDKLLNFDEVTSAKIGFVRNEAAWVVTRQYLLDNGVDASVIDAIENESTGSISYYGDTTSTAQAVQKGEIDLGFLPMEFALLYADAYDLEVVTAAGDLSPDYVCCREVTSNKRYTEKFDAFVAYETARIRAFEYYKKGETDAAVRADVVKTVSDYSGKEADYVDTYLYGGVTKFAVDPNTKGIEKYVEAAYNSGVFSSSAVDFGSYDITKNVDTSAYEKALDNLIAANPSNTFYASLRKEFDAAN